MFGFSILAAAVMAALSVQQTPAAGLVADPPPMGRPCIQDDLVGVWKSDLLAQGGRTAPTPLSTDYMRFGADGAMAYFAAPRAPATIEEVDHGLDLVAEAGPRFSASILGDGVLVIARDGTPVEGFTCTVLKNEGDEGELVLSQLKGRPPVYRHNRRLHR